MSGRFVSLTLVASAVMVLATSSISTAQLNSQPYPGIIETRVDVTDLDHRVFNVTQKIPVTAGPMSLWLPRWTPGTRGPNGAIANLAGLMISGNGKRIEWKRDTLDVYAFNLIVPENTKAIEVSFQSIPTEATIAPTMFNLKWIAMTLYPAGYDASQVNFRAALKVPQGWKPFTALDLDSQKGDLYRYKIIDFANLADSPVFAGKYFTTIDLDPGAPVPVRLNVVADDPSHLVTKPDHVEAHRNLVKQARKLYDSHHYDHYDFLLSLSKQLIRNGLEHHRSSENGQDPGYFTDWDLKTGSDDLLAHEYTHSWNGKFRRPQDLTTPNFNVPMQDSLLWVYEGQTEYWGNVLNARSGLETIEKARDKLAVTAAIFEENRPGLSWRALQDTTNEPIISYRSRKEFISWQLGTDYYRGGALIWLEADARIRAKSNGTKSLDDFAKAFFGVDNGSWKVKTYTFEDVVSTLNSIVADDWAGFLRQRLDGHGSLIGGLEASGWRLVFKDTPNAASKADAKESGGNDYTYSLGFVLDKEGRVGNVRWNGPAFLAGLGNGMTLVAIDDRQYTKDLIEEAIKAAQKGDGKITLLIKSSDYYRTVTIDYKGGLRYPHLERIEGKPDYLTAILSPRT